MADEVVPVGKDVVNYMADGTQDAVRTVASAVAEGLHAGSPGQEAHSVLCRKCNTANEASANFCKGCSAPSRDRGPVPAAVRRTTPTRGSATTAERRWPRYEI